MCGTNTDMRGLFVKYSLQNSSVQESLLLIGGLGEHQMCSKLNIPPCASKQGFRMKGAHSVPVLRVTSTHTWKLLIMGHLSRPQAYSVHLTFNFKFVDVLQLLGLAASYWQLCSTFNMVVMKLCLMFMLPSKIARCGDFTRELICCATVVLTLSNSLALENQRLLSQDLVKAHWEALHG